MSLPLIVQARVDRASAVARSYINQSATGTAQTINVSQVLSSLGSAKSAVLALPASNPAVAQTVAELDSLRTGVQVATQQASNAIASSADILAQQFPGAEFVRSLANLLPRRTAPSEDSAAVPTRPLSSTQATGSAPGAGTLVPDSAGTAESPTPVASPATSPGVGAPADDGSLNTVQREIVTQFGNDKIEPRPNVLDQYASYTYTISLYAMTIDAFQRMVDSGRVTLDGKFLLIQSGGAPVGGRNEFFSNDYYIDSLAIKSIMAGSGTRSSHNAHEFSMTVIEPNGLSLIDNLDKVASTLYSNDAEKKQRSFGATNYLLIIRFYGYDDQGQLVRARNNSNLRNVTDTDAVVEKFYPISITGITFEVASKAVEYRLTGVSASYNVAASVSKGTIPFNIEINGQTVQEVVAGQKELVLTSTGSAAAESAADQGREGRDQGLAGRPSPPPPPTATTAPRVVETIRKGLFAALNQFQQDLVNDSKASIADQYEIEFVGAAIPSASVNAQSASTVNIASTPMRVPGTSRVAVLDECSAVEPEARKLSITAGQQIVQVLDTIIRNSTYIKSQQLYSVAEGGDKAGKVSPNGRSTTLAWFKISFQATPIGFDTIRNSLAYRIKYIISPYQIFSAPIPWFLPPMQKGVHKEYNYWFTGENNSVINFSKEYNTLYTQILSGSLSHTLATETSNYNYLQTYVFAPRSGESSQGARNTVNEPAANLADYLYSPGTTDEIKFTIVGDPAYLQQGDVFISPTARAWNFGPFNPDGTINFESSQVLINFAFNRPVDYDTNTGLLDPGKNNFNADRNQGIPGLARQSFVYRVTIVNNTFDKGKFTQEINGTITRFPTGEVAKRIADAPTNQLTPQLLSTPLVAPVFNTGGTVPRAIDTILGSQSTVPAAFPLVATSGELSVNRLTGQFAPPPRLNSTFPVTSTTAQFGPATTLAPPQQMAAGDDQTQIRFGQPGFVQRAVRSVLSPQRSPSQRPPTLR